MKKLYSVYLMAVGLASITTLDAKVEVIKVKLSGANCYCSQNFVTGAFGRHGLYGHMDVVRGKKAYIKVHKIRNPEKFDLALVDKAVEQSGTAGMRKRAMYMQAGGQVKRDRGGNFIFDVGPLKSHKIKAVDNRVTSKLSRYVGRDVRIKGVIFDDNDTIYLKKVMKIQPYSPEEEEW